jgi:hypothetical protein
VAVSPFSPVLAELIPTISTTARAMIADPRSFIAVSFFVWFPLADHGQQPLQ